MCEWGTDELLTPPAFLERERPIAIDACIVPVVRHLWDRGVVTLGSCCGHREGQPSLVIAQDATTEFAGHVRALIAEVDDRYWRLLSWRLIDV